jgi:HEPN domain-containing protein
MLFDEDQFSRWLQQAEHTLRSASCDLRSGDYNWACFKSQQAGEYSIKALLRGLGKPAFGHSILKLVGELRETGLRAPEELENLARLLDRHYVPPRYPNAYPAGSPFEFYDLRVAQEAIESAQRLLEFIRGERQKL